ncbi:MAG: oxidoreductase [Lachnospiraceae bacterium]|nr:oxidoreductase [Lachnospiraceae bacterium]
MENLWITLPALAPDYSGVCSAMFDLGGICVIHDASGCTGNYTGYDEPRWYGSSSKIFCSAIREIDAVLGRDDKLIDNIIKAGEELHPTMYTVIGSPVPMVIGSDMKGIAHEVESRTGLPAFGFDTNGLGLYNKGIAMAMTELIKRFTKNQPEKITRGINILGSNAIDFSANENAQDLVKRLEDWDFQVIGKLMMGASIEQIENLAKAQVNLVVTESGMAAAKLLKRKYNIPYVVGMPFGDSEDVREMLEAALLDGEDRVLKDASQDGEILIVGEQVLCNSIRRAILSQRPESKITVGSMFGLDKTIAAEGDKNITSEEKLIELIDSGNYTTLVGDPLFEDLLAEDSSIKLVTLPHVALSSKLYWDKMPRLLTEEMDAFLEEIIGKEAFHIVA